MTTSKKISNKTSLFFEENKQRLSNAKQRLWNLEKWATSPSFTVLLIKHNECSELCIKTCEIRPRVSKLIHTTYLRKQSSI